MKSTQFQASKIEMQLLLDTINKRSISKSTLEWIKVITLNKPRVDYAKDLLILLKDGDTTTQ
jgi:hypothetical protein